MSRVTPATVKKMMNLKGEARGVTLKDDWTIILKDYGEESLRKLEKRMAELGFPLLYKDIKTMDFYPLGLNMLSILVIGELFHFDEQEFEELGRKEAKISGFFRFLIKHFASFHVLVKGVPKMWREHYNVGDLSVVELNEEERYVILRLENFKAHRAFCALLRGYLARVLEIARGVQVKTRETKCILNGDSYHEFLLQW